MHLVYFNQAHSICLCEEWKLHLIGLGEVLSELITPILVEGIAHKVHACFSLVNLLSTKLDGGKCHRGERRGKFHGDAKESSHTSFSILLVLTTPHMVDHRGGHCPLEVIAGRYLDGLLLIKHHVKKILDNESIKYTRDSIKAFIEEAFQYYPDCRRIINYLQFCCSSGELVVNLNKVAESEKNELIDAIVDKLKTANNMLEVRKFYLSEKDKISDYVEFGSILFKHVVDNGIVVDLDGILKMTDLLFQLNTVIDKESGFFGLLTAIAKWMER